MFLICNISVIEGVIIVFLQICSDRGHNFMIVLHLESNNYKYCTKQSNATCLPLSCNDVSDESEVPKYPKYPSLCIRDIDNDQVNCV